MQLAWPLQVLGLGCKVGGCCGGLARVSGGQRSGDVRRQQHHSRPYRCWAWAARRGAGWGGGGGGGSPSGPSFPCKPYEPQHDALSICAHPKLATSSRYASIYVLSHAAHATQVFGWTCRAQVICEVATSTVLLWWQCSERPFRTWCLRLPAPLPSLHIIPFL